MTNTTTEPTSDYLPGEALTGRMSAREWLERLEPGMFGIMNDLDRAAPGALAQGIAEITERGHAEAARLNLPHSPPGHYPPVVWELEVA
jgi:hypothetical protein